jgi:tRNA threonylcarbamoyl adenosine modification protein (Sua5/YciO/YrdC/YwlC family)
MLLYLHPENPQPRTINTIVDCLQDGGLIIYPTDTVYGLGCDIFHQKAMMRLCKIKKLDPAKAKLSFICHDLSDLSHYTRTISTPLFRVLKNYLPGPYTFVLPASKQVPKILKNKKNAIGLRIPDNLIARTIVKELGHPILSSSLPGNSVEEYTDPELMHENFKNLVDLVVDGGIGGTKPSTVIDYTSGDPVVLRKGLGIWPEDGVRFPDF